MIFVLNSVQEFNSRFFASKATKTTLWFGFSILQAFAIALIYIKFWERQGASEKVVAKDSFVSASQETVYEYSYWFTKYFLGKRIQSEYI